MEHETVAPRTYIAGLARSVIPGSVASRRHRSLLSPQTPPGLGMPARSAECGPVDRALVSSTTPRPEDARRSALSDLGRAASPRTLTVDDEGMDRCRAVLVHRTHSVIDPYLVAPTAALQGSSARAWATMSVLVIPANP